jgi:euchromatic histone-lysine N-methyltransferase
MRRKIKFTVGKTVQPPVKANHMSQLVTLDRPFSSTSATAMKTQLVTLDRPFSSTSATAMKKFKPASIDLASTSALASKEKRKFESVFVTKEKLKGKRVVYLEDDDILMAVAVHEGKLELCLGAPSRVHVWRHRPHGREPYADPRIRVRMMCRRFQFLCKFLAQAVKQGSVELSRVDLAADNAIKKLPDYIKYGSIVGEVDGVEVGDEFLFRVELAIVGLHNPIRAGIDTTKDKDGEPIAVSIVASGGYLDKYSSSGELIYIGSGGKAAGTGQDGDQKLERGNLALQNCFDRKIPVRVTHGFKTPNTEKEGSHCIGKEMPKFIYCGLYHVVSFWEAGEPGSRVFKYRLRRKHKQPQLPPHVAELLQKSVVGRPADVSSRGGEYSYLNAIFLSTSSAVKPESLSAVQ